jgi:hypothetical protein
MALQGNAMVWTDATHVCAIWTTWHAVVRALYGFCYGKLEALGEYVNVDSNGRISIESLLGIPTLSTTAKPFFQTYRSPADSVSIDLLCSPPQPKLHDLDI